MTTGFKQVSLEDLVFLLRGNTTQISTSQVLEMVDCAYKGTLLYSKEAGLVSQFPGFEVVKKATNKAKSSKKGKLVALKKPGRRPKAKTTDRSLTAKKAWKNRTSVKRPVLVFEEGSNKIVFEAESIQAAANYVEATHGQVHYALNADKEKFLNGYSFKYAS